MDAKWKAPDSRNGRLFVKRWVGASKTSFCEKAASRKVAKDSVFATASFFFPTWFHEQPEKVRKSAGWTDSSRGESDLELPEPNADRIDIKYFAKLESSHLIASWQLAEALEPFHILQANVVRERFEYDQALGLQVALVRIFRIRPTWTIANEKKYRGCRSWVNLPEPPKGLRFEPVLSDTEHAACRNQFLELMRAPESPHLNPLPAGEETK